MQTPIIDSEMSLKDALAGKDIPPAIRDTLVLLDVRYVSFDGLLHQGQLVVHQKVAQELQELFQKLLEIQFPIERVAPVVVFGWDDDASMAANNTSAFNYRLIHGTDRLSNHSYGLAVDINPALNPYIRRDGQVVPPGAAYDVSRPGTLTVEVASLFKSRGWGWGGDWEHKDWQHFEKPA